MAKGQKFRRITCGKVLAVKFDSYFAVFKLNIVFPTLKEGLQ